MHDQGRHPQARPARTESSPKLTKFAWISIAAAVATIALKTGAFLVTDSVSLLSDAMESVVNLVAAIVALVALGLAARPANSRFTFGRSKVEYFSAAIEGTMIFGAAALIIFAAIQRLVSPTPVENIGQGAGVAAVASLINGGVGVLLLRAGKEHSSPTLEADGKHLLTDVITSVGVIIGVLLVWLTGWQWLDPVVAILVGLNIVYIGIGLVRSSVAGLLDVTLPDKENQQIVEILRKYAGKTVTFHGLQTRSSGQERHIKVDAQVPGTWTVKEGHDFTVKIERDIQAVLANVHVVIHVEPIEDPESYTDIPEGFVPLDGVDGFVPIDLATGKPIQQQQ